MKKKLTALLCALLIGACALAETPSVPAPSPAPEAPSAIQAGGSMSATLNGQTLTLDFDPDPQFSVCRDGYVQASFYAYGEADLLYELYVTFPQNVSAGQSVTAQSSLTAADLFSGVYLYVSDNTSESASAATQYLTGPYPEGSGYELSFSSVSYDGAFAAFAGTLTASLVEIDPYLNPTGTVNEFSGSFSFTMDLGEDAARPDEGHAAPKSTPPASESPDRAGEDAPSPAPTPQAPSQQRPPAAPAKLITPANAKKI